MATALPVTIKNPRFNEYIAEGVDYHKAGTTYYDCEQDRREKSWASSAILAALGLVVTYLYYDEYSDVVDKRNELNEKVYQCALKEHEHWRDHTHPHTLEAFDWVYDLPEIVPEYAAPSGAPSESAIAAAMASWASSNAPCKTCDTSAEVAASAVLGGVAARTALMRNDERRGGYRREMKASGMAVLDKAGKNTAAPGRQSMAVGLSLINTLVAMASSGMNSGLNMLGTGLADLGNRQSNF